MTFNSSDDLCHVKCAPSKVEVLARDTLADLVHDDDLFRVCERESSQPKPDFRSARHVLEIKELASPALRSYLHAQQRYIGDRRFYPVEALRETWGVFADLSPAVGSFERTTASPTMKSIVRSLTPLLVQLEADNASDAFADPAVWPFVSSILHGGHCSVMPRGTFAPGIFFLGYGYEHARTTYVEADVVGFVQAWLDSSYAENLRHSLAGERGVRAAVLVASTDGPALAMTRTLEENPGVAPRTPLRLPHEVDAVVVITPRDVLDYGLANGWRRRAVAMLDAS
jgi:hypothetical protein